MANSIGPESAVPARTLVVCGTVAERVSATCGYHRGGHFHDGPFSPFRKRFLSDLMQRRAGSASLSATDRVRAGETNAVGLLHDAGASHRPRLVADAARGPRGDHPRRQARLLRRLRRRAPDRRVRERHQQHAVPRHADPRHQDHQARDRHHQSVADASGGDRGERGDVRPSGARPLHHGHLRRRAAFRLRGDRNSRPGPQQDLRRGDRRDPGDLGARSALQHRFPGQPLQGGDQPDRRAASRRRRHGEAVPEAAAGDRRHRGGAVLARRGADGQARLPSAVGELPARQASQVALDQLRQGQGRSRRRRPTSPTGASRAPSLSPTTTRPRCATAARTPRARTGSISSRWAPR